MKAQVMISPKFLAGLIIAGVLLFGFCTAAGKVWRMSTSSQEDSVSKLAAAINQVANEQSSFHTTVTLQMEQKGGVLVFAPEQPTIKAKYKGSEYNGNMVFKRPDACALDKGCVCSCHLYGSPNLIPCLEPACHALTGIQLMNNFKECTLNGNQCMEYANGGGIFYNQFKIQAQFGQEKKIGVVRGQMGVFVQKQDDYVSVCDKLPCFSEEDQRIIRQIQAIKEGMSAVTRCMATATNANNCGCGSMEIVQDLPEYIKVVLEKSADKLYFRLVDSRSGITHFDEFLTLPLRVAFIDRTNRNTISKLEFTWQTIQRTGNKKELGFFGQAADSRFIGFWRADNQVNVMAHQQPNQDPSLDYLLLKSGAVYKDPISPPFIDVCSYTQNSPL